MWHYQNLNGWWQRIPIDADQMTLNVVTQNQFTDDLLFAGDTLVVAETFAKEGIEPFQSRGFKLRKRLSNSPAKPALLQVSNTITPHRLARLILGRNRRLTRSTWPDLGSSK